MTGALDGDQPVSVSVVESAVSAESRSRVKGPVTAGERARRRQHSRDSHHQQQQDEAEGGGGEDWGCPFSSAVLVPR